MKELLISELGEFVETLHAGEAVFLSGVLYTARDAAHRRIIEILDRGEPLPFPIKESVIYYTGPTPAAPGCIIGACGPTTSVRMDGFTPRLLDLGLRGMIGKGNRTKPVLDALVRNSGVYFCALGGAGALMASCVESCDEIAFDDLGCESVKRLKVKNMPLIVAADSFGGNIFQKNSSKKDGAVMKG